MRSNSCKNGPRKILLTMQGVHERKIEVFCKPTSLEIAHLETGAALEHPAFGQLLMGCNACNRAVQRIIVFFNNVREHARRSGDIKKLPLTDLAAAP